MRSVSTLVVDREASCLNSALPIPHSALYFAPLGPLAQRLEQRTHNP
jgi:hypothetical protein